jgi:hypothetical protein
MKWMVGALLLVSYPAHVEAESLIFPLAVYGTAAAADLHSTYQALQYQGVRESNPFGRGLSDKPGTLVVAGAAADVAVVWALHWTIHKVLRTKEHRRFEKVALYGAASVRLMLAKHNYGNARGVRKP